MLDRLDKAKKAARLIREKLKQKEFMSKLQWRRYQIAVLKRQMYRIELKEYKGRRGAGNSSSRSSSSFSGYLDHEYEEPGQCA